MADARAAPLDGRIAVVTGATRGIGRACACALGAAGAKVFAVGRTQGALEALDDEIRALGGPDASLVPLDLIDGPAIDALGGAIFQRHGRLDILVHAAGLLGGLRPVAHVPPPLWDRMVGVNLTSAVRLIRSLEPLLRASDAGRAVFFTSAAARTPRAFWGAYGALQSAVETLVLAWQDEMDVSPLRVLLVDPGPVRTQLRAQAFPGEDPAPLPSPDSVATLILARILSAEAGPRGERICLSPLPQDARRA